MGAISTACCVLLAAGVCCGSAFAAPQEVDLRALSQRAEELAKAGDWEASRDAWRAMLEAGGDNAPSTWKAKAFCELAAVMAKLGDVREVGVLCRAALRELDSLPVTDRVGVRLLVAQSYLDVGWIDDALAVAQDAYNQASARPDDPSLVPAAQVLADVLDAVGDLHRVHELDARVVSVETSDRVSAQIKLGETKSKLGLHAEAIALLEQTVDASEKQRDGALFLKAKAGLATALGRADRDEEAVDLLDGVVKTLSEIRNPEAQRNLTVLRLNLAVACAKSGQLQRAGDLFEDVLPVLEQSPDRRNYIRALEGSASALYSLHRRDEARTRMHQAMTLAREILLPYSKHLSLREQKDHARTLHSQVSSLLSCRELGSLDGDLDKQDLEAVLSFRGLVERYARRVTKLHELAADDEGIRDLLSRIQTAARSMVKQASGGRSTDASPRDVEELERKLLQRLGRVDPTEREPSLDELLAALPKDTTAIVTFRYFRYVPVTPGKHQPDPVQQFTAFVAEPTGRVRRFEIGGVDHVKAAADRFRRALRAGKTDGSLGEVLRPVLEAVHTAGSLLICPDAELAAVPWHALPIGDDEIVNDRHRVVYGDSLDTILPRAATAGGASLLVVGDVDYGAGASWMPLASSLLEVDDVVSAFVRHAPEGMHDTLTRSDATVAKFIRAATGRRFLHVATHAFVRRAQGTDALGPTAGLVFAGANRSGNDAVLFASELQTLDLSACQLAFLSACDTNRGEPGDFGDAVAGLNRALHLAGARATITSLWQVDSYQTKQFVGWFYDALWQSSVSVAEAFHVAVKRAREEKLSPEVWAGFVPYGRP